MYTNQACATRTRNRGNFSPRQAAFVHKSGWRNAFPYSIYTRSLGFSHIPRFIILDPIEGFSADGRQCLSTNQACTTRIHIRGIFPLRQAVLGPIKEFSAEGRQRLSTNQACATRTHGRRIFSARQAAFAHKSGLRNAHPYYIYIRPLRFSHIP